MSAEVIEKDATTRAKRKAPNMTAAQKKAAQQKRLATLRAKKETEMAASAMTEMQQMIQEFSSIQEQMITSAKENTAATVDLLNEAITPMQDGLKKLENRLDHIEVDVKQAKDSAETADIKAEAAIDGAADANGKANTIGEELEDTRHWLERRIWQPMKDNLTPSMPDGDQMKAAGIAVLAQDAIVLAACRMSPGVSDAVTGTLAYRGERFELTS